jgi:hypothetical protein
LSDINNIDNLEDIVLIINLKKILLVGWYRGNVEKVLELSLRINNGMERPFEKLLTKKIIINNVICYYR